MCSVLNHCAARYWAHELFSWPEIYSVCSCAGWCVDLVSFIASRHQSRSYVLGSRVSGIPCPLWCFTLISVILFVDLRGIFIVRACHHLWGYTGPDEFSAIETGWRNQWPFNMAPHFLNIGFRFISWWLRYIHFNLIQEFPFLAFLLEGRSSQWLGLGLSARLDFCVNSLSISMVTHWRHHLFLCIWLVLLLIRHTY